MPWVNTLSYPVSQSRNSGQGKMSSQAEGYPWCSDISHVFSDSWNPGFGLRTCSLLWTALTRNHPSSGPPSCLSQSLPGEMDNTTRKSTTFRATGVDREIREFLCWVDGAQWRYNLDKETIMQKHHNCCQQYRSYRGQYQARNTSFAHAPLQKAGNRSVWKQLWAQELH